MVLSPSRAGLLWGLLGVGAFSFTVPFTRVAVAGDGMSPLFIGSARALVAALLAAAALASTRQRLPRGAQWARLAVVGGGVVVGFPVLTSFALTTASAGHSAVVIALLPAATAVMAVLRERGRGRRNGSGSGTGSERERGSGHERLPVRFWAAAGAGALAAVLFASLHGGGLDRPHWSDLLLIGAVLAAAIGYAEGGLLARELGAWQTISWALVLVAPVTVALSWLAVAHRAPSGSVLQWAAFGYLGVVSMFLGFFAWYRGLAIGPMARVSQIQLVQPVLNLCWAALLLGEPLGWSTALGAVAVIACAGTAVRARTMANATARTATRTA